MRKPTNAIQAPMTTNLVSTSATASTGALVGTSSAFAINNGEVALLSSDINAADFGELTATPDGLTAKLVQGTPVSNNIAANDPWGVSDPALVSTTDIMKDGVRSITTTNYNSGAYAMSAFTAMPTPVASTEYGVIVELDGVRQQREFGTNTDQPSATATTAAILPTNAKDFVLQTIAAKLNRQSQLLGATKRFVVLGLNIAGGAGTVLADLVNDNAAIDFQLSDGTTYNVQSTTTLIRGLANLIAASATITADSTIEVINSLTAGSAATIDALVVVGLDSGLSVYEDTVVQLRTDVTINPSLAYESEGTIETAYASEGEGLGRQIKIDNRAQLDVHTKQTTPYMEYFSEGYTYLDSAKNYGATYVDYIGLETQFDAEYTREKQAVIYWEQTEPITLSVDGVAGGTTAVNAFTPTETKPAVIAQLATWASNVSEVTV